jgi:hypothetical protein
VIVLLAALVIRSAGSQFDGAAGGALELKSQFVAFSHLALMVLVQLFPKAWPGNGT